MNRKLGVAIMVIGASMLIWTSFTTPQPKEKMVATNDDNSNITYHNTPKKHDSISWNPYVGTILVAGGLLITITSKRTDKAFV